MNRSGYAQAAQDYIYALRESGDYSINMRLFHAKADEVSITSKRYSEIMEMIQSDSGEDCVQILHGIPDKQIHLKLAKKSVGFATFETHSPPEHWIKLLNSNSAVIVPSEFNKNVFKNAGITCPIFHIPHCVDTKIYHPKVNINKQHPEFTFLFFGTWKQRKGWSQLIEAWFKEFSVSDNVRLVLKTDRITMAQRGIEEIKSKLGLKKDYAPISFETKILNEEEIPLLIKKFDCLVSPSLGEGFGLPGLQAMALGVPIIITNYSGCQDYANSETATLIEPKGFIQLSDMDNIPQFQSRPWAHITVEEVASKMRYAVCNQDKIIEKADFAAKFVAQNFNYKVTAQRFTDMIGQL